MALTVFHCFSHLYAQEQIAPIALRSVALYKRATVSDSLPSIFTKERRERIAIGKEQNAISLTKNERFARKSKSKFPTLAFITEL